MSRGRIAHSVLTRMLSRSLPCLMVCWISRISSSTRSGACPRIGSEKEDLYERAGLVRGHGLVAGLLLTLTVLVVVLW